MVEVTDSFSASITVYTYDGGQILEKQCETTGWPNITHDGLIMSDNAFSTDKATVVAWAKRNADIGIRYASESVSDADARLSECKRRLAAMRGNREKLEADYPGVGLEESESQDTE
jgi:hypothetical protein